MDMRVTPDRFLIYIEDSGEAYLCEPRQDLLRAMERLGRRGIPVGCRGGGCGVCKVEILEGEYTARKMSRAHVSVAEEEANIGLACRISPLSDLRLRVLGKLKRIFGNTPAGG
jgi:ferredoxin